MYCWDPSFQERQGSTDHEAEYMAAHQRKSKNAKWKEKKSVISFKCPPLPPRRNAGGGPGPPDDFFSRKLKILGPTGCIHMWLPGEIKGWKKAEKICKFPPNPPPLHPVEKQGGVPDQLCSLCFGVHPDHLWHRAKAGPCMASQAPAPPLKAAAMAAVPPTT